MTRKPKSIHCWFSGASLRARGKHPVPILCVIAPKNFRHFALHEAGCSHYGWLLLYSGTVDKHSASLTDNGFLLTDTATAR